MFNDTIKQITNSYIQNLKLKQKLFEFKKNLEQDLLYSHKKPIMSMMMVPFLSFSNPSLNRGPDLGAIDYQELFSSDPVSWVSSSSAIAVTAGVCRVLVDNSTGVIDDAYIDLANASNLGSNLSDTLWTVDCTYDITLRVSTDAGQFVSVYLGMADGTGAINSGDQFRILIDLAVNSGSDGRAGFTSFNGGVLDGDNRINGTITSTGFLYLRVIRKSATSARMIISANSDWSSPLYDQTVTILSTIISLQYWRVWAESSATTTDDLNIDVDTLRVYDGEDRVTTDFTDTS